MKKNDENITKITIPNVVEHNDMDLKEIVKVQFEELQKYDNKISKENKDKIHNLLMQTNDLIDSCIATAEYEEKDNDFKFKEH